MATPQAGRDSDQSLAALKTATDATISLLHGCLEVVSAIVKSHREAAAAAPASTSPPASLEQPGPADGGQQQPTLSGAPAESYTDPLATAHSAALLIRANSTKIGLLLMNPPFTPSAIASVVRELGSGAIPALAAAAQEIDGAPEAPNKADQARPRYHYTALVRQEAVRASWRVLEQLRLFLVEIPLSKSPTATEQAARKDAVGSLTGLLWAACDRLAELSRPGGVGPKDFLIKTVEGYAAVMKDTLEELKEWGEEESDSESEAEESGSEGSPARQPAETEADGDRTTVTMSAAGNKHEAAQSLADALFVGHNRRIPASDPSGLRPRLELIVRRLRLCTLLCTAIVKRRLKPLPVSTATSASTATAAVPWLAHHPTTSRLDAGLGTLAAARDAFDECAGALYELDPAATDAALDTAFARASTAARIFGPAWHWDVLPSQGKGGVSTREEWTERDDFTAWADRFVNEIGQGQ